MSASPRFGTAVLAALLLAATGRAQEVLDLAAADGLAPPRYGLWDVIAPRVGVAYYAGEGFGYRQDYTTLDAFVPLAGGRPDRLPFLDLRGIVSDSHLWAGNFAVGRRSYDPDRDRIYGAWASYDLRDTGSFDFQQFSGGLETIGRSLDLRGSFYLPTGPDRRQFGDLFLCDPTFSGTHILLSHVRAFETALANGDVEVGGPLPWLGRRGVRGYAGVYYFQGDGGLDGVGVRGRIDARLSDTFRLGLQVQNDREFGTTAVVSAAVHWGGIRRRYRSTVDTVYSRFADEIIRNHEIAVATQTTTAREPATDPQTGLPITVIHVNNTAPPGGNGSVEHPLNVLAPAPGLAGIDGIILVYRGDGTPRGMNQGVVLEDGQRLLGDSLHYTFVSREAGVCPLPNLLTGRPTITNLSGDAVVLANRNEVAGVTIIDPQGNGIRGTGITDFNLHDNVITTANNVVTGALFTGILLQGVAGTGTIANNQLTGNSTGASVETAGGATLNLTVAGNTVTNNGTGVVLTSTGSSRLGAALTANTISGNAFGVMATSAGTSQLSYTASGNTIDNNSQAGIIQTSADQSRLRATITGNTFLSDGVGFEGVSQNQSNTREALANNTFGGAGGVIKVFALSLDTSRQGVAMSGNLVTGSSPVGVELDGQASSTLVAAVDHNTISGTFLFGFATLSQNTATDCLGLHHNASSGALAAYTLVRDPGSTFLLEQDNGTNAGSPFTQSPGITSVPAGSCVP